MGTTLGHNRPPAARTTDILVERVGDETVVYDLKSKDVHCLSPLAATVFESCDGSATRDEIAIQAAAKLNEDVTEEAVLEAVAQLRERSLLESPPVIVKNGNGGISRRELGKKAALGGAAFLSVPLISSIAAPMAMAGSSQVPTGCSGCGKPHDCVSNHCCQNVAGKSCNQTCCVQHDNSCHLSASGACTVILDVPTDCVSVSCPPGHPKCCCCDKPADIANGCPPCT